MRYTKTEIEGARERLAGLLTVGTVVYTLVRHVSKSGLSREIDLYVIRDNKPVLLTYSAAALLGLPVGHRGVKVQGAGMDMGFHLVESLSRVLYRESYALSHEWL